MKKEPKRTFYAKLPLCLSADCAEQPPRTITGAAVCLLNVSWETCLGILTFIKQALSKTEFCAKVLLDTFLSRKVSGKTDQKTLRYSSRLSFSNRWMPARLFPLASRAGE